MMQQVDEYKDSRWIEKRRNVLKRDNFACRLCNAGKEYHLIVHRKCLFKDRKIWDYEDDMLLTLCKKCQNLFHDSFEENKVIVNIRLPRDEFFIDEIQKILGYQGTLCEYSELPFRKKMTYIIDLIEYYSMHPEELQFIHYLYFCSQGFEINGSNQLEYVRYLK